MECVFDARQIAHDPQTFLVAGRLRPSPEQPRRAEVLLNGATAAGLEVIAPADYGRGPIAAVHTAEYLEFLETIHARWSALPDANAEVVPNVHPDRRAASYPSSPVGLAGWHLQDTACPVGAATWESAYWSAQTALTATELVMEGERSVYALCRPPGHHALADAAGGFCFLANSAIAAQRLRDAGRRVTILDVDVHHGNGTQSIFYDRGDVLTVSIHCDPSVFYPFFWGHASERGIGQGEGCNLNLPLARGTSDDGFLEALEAAFRRIRAFGTDALVVALGLDAYEGDPLAGLGVTTPGFARIGEAIGKLGLPTVLVQEGGYLSEELGQNLTSFLGGFGTGAAATGRVEV
ncbi:histone deacetylase family protein [Albimonas sp. CAU 1670]|uniref:histone deacetylase family protein n=1 Tax=Albimonas sp. CAU 1670 TaxID=3032599 RepID=UPI0023D9E0F5|nr:histone deacetylase family protein [Albimonas sp. CAU 1670]MDF2233536.1 histone deacetylase family protein [Albimonas sp. CAU 1670]